ncbi:MAG TPA: hypothetical protein DCP31_10075, partial [Cyanobacteria bacterium UBA8543]|nr:hypothetical protein [Cyanobacteria bacterium UBA8543]
MRGSSLTNLVICCWLVVKNNKQPNDTSAKLRQAQLPLSAGKLRASKQRTTNNKQQTTNNKQQTSELFRSA